MLKKAITYDTYNEDADGNPVPVTQDFYFNMTKLELIELELDMNGGLEALVEELKSTQDAKKAWYIFKRIILMTYGKKSEDGLRFSKSPEITKEFEDSPALSELIFSFIENPEDGAKFIEACFPSKMVAEAKRAAEAQKETEAKLVADKARSWAAKQENGIISQEDFEAANPPLVNSKVPTYTEYLENIRNGKI